MKRCFSLVWLAVALVGGLHAAPNPSRVLDERRLARYLEDAPTLEAEAARLSMSAVVLTEGDDDFSAETLRARAEEYKADERTRGFLLSHGWDSYYWDVQLAFYFSKMIVFLEGQYPDSMPQETRRMVAEYTQAVHPQDLAFMREFLAELAARQNMGF